jgi:hypothetical protein
MISNANYACPLCNQAFSSADGLTAAEHLARGILAAVKKMQDTEAQDDFAEDMRQCARCGEYRMIPGIARNSLSRHADVMICPICGTDEAARVFSDNVLPLSEWYIVNAILENGSV